MLFTRNIEVKNENLIIICDQKILWFDVSMGNVVVVEVFDALNYLQEKMTSIFFSIVAMWLLGNMIENFLTLNIPHYLMNLTFNNIFIIFN